MNRFSIYGTFLLNRFNFQLGLCSGCGQQSRCLVQMVYSLKDMCHIIMYITDWMQMY